MFTVYSSSAGSGKTFTLVSEYLKIIVAEPEAFRNILAITFTNKAANEMKERVLKALDALVRGDAASDRRLAETLLPLLTRETGLSQGQISENASRAYRLILHNYADFAVGTIDSFTHRLIRTFAHDFGLPVNFNVELDADEMLAESVDLLLEQVGDNEELTGLLVHFLENRMEDDKDWKIAELLTSFARILLEEDSRDRILPLRDISLAAFDRIAGALFQRINGFEARVKELAKQGVSILQNSALSPSDLYRGEQGVWNFFFNLAAGRMDRITPNSYVVAAFSEGKWYSAKAGSDTRQAIDAVMPDLSGIYQDICALSESGLGDYLLRKLLAKTIYPMAVLNEIDKVMTAFKQRNNLVHISEFNARIAGIVMNEPVPFIYERLGEKYRHILIDEFQDTSVLQWLNFVPLVENSLAGGHFNLVVGDGKQAIYRWRGGEVEQFSSLPSLPGSAFNPIIREREMALQRHYQRHSLDRNFRSREEIVLFNNRLFRVLADQVLTGGREKIYQGLEQKSHPDKQGGYVYLEFLAGEEGVDYSRKMLETTARLISEVRADGYRLRDIAILCRSNHTASLVARHLIAAGIEVVSADSLLLVNSAGVRFLVSCMRYLFEPENDIVKTEISEYIRREIPEGTVARELGKERYEFLPVYDLCESLIRDFGLRTDNDPYLQFFLDAVLKFTIRVSPGSSEFLEWWDKNKLKHSITVPEELDAVRVITIHKAKGLEFPVVILPFAHDSRTNTREYLWVDLDDGMATGITSALVHTDSRLESTRYAGLLEEEKQKSMLDLVNLLYVATTRPEDRLYLLSRRPPAREEEIHSLPGFFRLFLKSVEAWEEGRSVYTFGSCTPVEKTGQQEFRETLRPDLSLSADWRDRILIRRRASEAWDLDNPAGKVGWGNRIHTLLSWLNTANDLDFVIARGMQAGLLDLSEREHASRILMTLISHPSLRSLYGDGITAKTETEILLRDGTFLRPDRVVFDGERVVVVDYKTGLPMPEHAAQMRRYAGCLRDMGYPGVETRLVYLEPEIRVVSGD